MLFRPRHKLTADYIGIKNT
jgi:hypothetical protein